ncbi:MAG: heat-inducible transcription repressor HrcA [Nitrospinae bacterium]|nr:heat-inducible transcription repressor HrcA [Nitrospinota bacterium]
MNHEKTLDERSAKVLRNIIERFIRDPEPVGAKSIAALTEFNLSPATIRNVMAELENQGYLFQPHTSAGRAPTDEGYRYYAHELAMPARLSAGHKREIEDATADAGWTQAADLLAGVTKTLARLSEQAGMMGFVSLGEAPVRRIQFVPVNREVAVAVVVKVNGTVSRHVIRGREPLPAAELERMSNYFNERFSSLTLTQIRRLLSRELREDEERINRAAAWALSVARSLEEQERQRGGEAIHLDGAANLLSGEEDTGLEGARALIGALEEKRRMLDLIEEVIKGQGVRLAIGSELEMKEFSACAMVAHPFSGAGGVSGAVGIIGRKRMDYALAISLVTYTAGMVRARLAGTV